MGEKLGTYAVIAPIGAGGMGEVFHARGTRLGREVAIKVSAEQFTLLSSPRVVQSIRSKSMQAAYYTLLRPLHRAWPAKPAEMGLRNHFDVWSPSRGLAARVP